MEKDNAGRSRFRGGLVALLGVVLGTGGAQFLEMTGSSGAFAMSLRVPASRARQSAGALLVLHHGATYAVLGRAQQAWASPMSKVLPHSRYEVLLQRPAAAKLPSAMRRWAGRSIDLYNGAQRVCRARVSRLGLMTRLNRWALGQRRADESRADQILREANLIGAKTFLVAEVIPLSGQACDSATWAFAAMGERPTILARSRKVPLDLRRKGMTAFRTLASYRAIQRSYLKEVKPRRKSLWDKGPEGIVQVAWFRSPASGRSFLVVSARAGRGCGEFRGELWAAWEVTNLDGAWALGPRTRGGLAETFVPDVVVSGAASYDLLKVGNVFRLGGPRVRYQSVDVPSQMCSC